jgi:hypothetical protein
MYCKMLFVAVSLMLDTHPWYQLLGLCVPTLVILFLVLIDKPFRCPDGAHAGMTNGDWQMVLAQTLQLLSYAVAALCLMNQQGRQAEGEAGLSEGVKLFAALAGLAIVVVQLSALVPSLWGHATSKGEPEPEGVVTLNVLMMGADTDSDTDSDSDSDPDPEAEAEPEQSSQTDKCS